MGWFLVFVIRLLCWARQLLVEATAAYLDVRGGLVQSCLSLAHPLRRSANGSITLLGLALRISYGPLVGSQFILLRRGKFVCDDLLLVDELID